MCVKADSQYDATHVLRGGGGGVNVPVYVGIDLSSILVSATSYRIAGNFRGTIFSCFSANE